MSIAKGSMNATKKFTAFTVGLVVTYWSASQFHATTCAPPGLWGLLRAPLTMGSPLCLVVTEIMSKTAQVYSAVWVGVIASGVSWAWDMCSEVGGIKIRT